MTQACDDGNDCTENDMEVILLSDGSICEPCMGTPLDCMTGPTTMQACDDGNASTINDMETIYTHTVDKGIKIIGFDAEWARKAVASGRKLHGRVACLNCW